jgi:hypothetical protein
MPFDLAALLDEAKGVAPVTFKTTFPDSKIVYPYAEELAQREPTATKPVAQKQPTKKHVIAKHLSHTAAVPQGRTHTVTSEVERRFQNASKQPVAKSTVEKLLSDLSPGRKGPKSSRALRNPISKLPKAAGASTQGVREKKHLQDQFDVESDDGNTFDRSKKRCYEEFEITADTDLTALEALATKPILKAPVEPAKRPAMKKLKTASGKAAVPRTATKKRVAKAEHSDEDAELTLRKIPAKKAVSCTASKSTAAEAKAKKPAAKKSPSPKKPAVNKKLVKVLGKGDNAPGMGAKITAAQLAARKGSKQ